MPGPKMRRAGPVPIIIIGQFREPWPGQPVENGRYDVGLPSTMIVVPASVGAAARGNAVAPELAVSVDVCNEAIHSVGSNDDISAPHILAAPGRISLARCLGIVPQAQVKKTRAPMTS